MKFKFRFMPTLFTVPALIVLVGLGVWQLHRLQWKETLIDRLQSRAEQVPVDLPKGMLDEAADEFRAVTVTGHFDNAHEFYLVNRSLNGNAGMHILTPLIRDDGDGAVLVDRGWVPFDKVDPATRKQGQIEGEVTVTGILRFPKGASVFTPDNDIEKNNWFYIELDRMAQLAKLNFENYYILSGDKDIPGEYPVGAQWTLDVPNNHLQYALTWFGLAGALLVIYLAYARQEALKEADED